MSKPKLRDTGNHVRPIEKNRAVSTLMWEDGEVFSLVPRQRGDIRTVELTTVSEDGAETVLCLDYGSIGIIMTELRRLQEWVDAERKFPFSP